MTREQAVKILESGGKITNLADAIGVLISDPRSPIEDLLLGLRHRGFIGGWPSDVRGALGADTTGAGRVKL